MQKLLIATTNKAKIVEFKKYFSIFLPELKLATLSDLQNTAALSRGVNPPVGGTPPGCDEGCHEPIENGKTFEENALIKARFYAKKSGLYTLADDGGFEIRALGDKPGVLSKRWPGYEATDKELVEMVLRKLKGAPLEKRQAQLRLFIVIVDPRGNVVAKEGGVIKGIVPKKQASWIEKDFPFRAVLYLPLFKKFYQDLTDKEHDSINHRRKAVASLAQSIKRLPQHQKASSFKQE